MNRSGTDNLFRPDIAASKAGGIVLRQNGQRIVIEDGDVEWFVSEVQAVRRRQLVRDCVRIVEAA